MTHPDGTLQEYGKKIIRLDEIGKVIEDLKAEGRIVVSVNGSFDILHPGHVYFLTEAKRQGDVLVVGLNSDSSVRRNKGDGRPINDQQSRAIMLASLEMVDYVTIFKDDTPIAFLNKVRPDVHCNGEEYGKDCVEAQTVEKIGARLHLIPRIGEWSTTSIAEKSTTRKQASP